MKHFLIVIFAVLFHFSVSVFGSPAIEIETLYDIKIPVHDGVNLSGIIVKPKIQNVKYPALFVLTPYMADRNHENACYFARSGYVVVTVDTRGRGNSEGIADPFGKTDGKDGADICKWIIKQPWSNGKIGMFGGSYLGMTQWQTLKENPPGLQTIVPTAAVCPGIDFPKRNNVFYTYVGPYMVYIDGKALNTNSFLDIENWKPIYSEFFGGKISYSQIMNVSGIENENIITWLKHPDYDKYWKSLVPSENEFKNFNIPILTITGYYDDDQHGAMFYYRNLIKNTSSPQKDFLVIGPWDHSGTRKPQVELGELKFDKNCVIDMLKLQLEWFDWILKGKERPAFLTNQVVYYVMGKNCWENTDHIKNLEQSIMELYPSSPVNNATELYNSGSLVTELSNEPVPDTVFYNPLDKSFLSFDLEECQLINYSLYKNREINKNGELIYHSKPIDRTLTISGQIRFTAFISMDVKDADFEILLYEVKPDGEVVFLTTDFLRARYRNGLESQDFPVSGTICKYEFKTTYLIVRQLSKGSRIRLILRNLNSPHYEKNFQSGGVISNENFLVAKSGVFKFYHNSAYPSRLEIPILRIE